MLRFNTPVTGNYEHWGLYVQHEATTCANSDIVALEKSFDSSKRIGKKPVRKVSNSTSGLADTAH